MSEILPGDDGDAEQNNYRMLCRTWERNREGVSQMLLGSRFSQVEEEEEERNEFSFLAIGLRFECAPPPPPPSENE